MASYNRVMLIGNLTRNIDLKYTAGGLAVSEMGLAVNDRRKNKDGQWVDDVCFVEVTLFGRTAEVASEYLSKGSPVFVEGRLKYDSWEKDGQKRNRLTVVCERMQLIGGREQSSDSRGGGRSDSPNSGGSPNNGGSPASSSTANSKVSEPSSSFTQQGRGLADPTGDGAGYDDPDIPF